MSELARMTCAELGFTLTLSFHSFQFHCQGKAKTSGRKDPPLTMLLSRSKLYGSSFALHIITTDLVLVARYYVPIADIIATRGTLMPRTESGNPIGTGSIIAVINMEPEFFYVSVD
jgi:hypothetical protein